jgi:hypothetical protein
MSRYTFKISRARLPAYPEEKCRISERLVNENANGLYDNISQRAWTCLMSQHSRFYVLWTSYKIRRSFVFQSGIIPVTDFWFKEKTLSEG